MKETLKELKKYRFTHRGFHEKPEIPENSMPAFLRTKEHGWGTELDIHLMKDGNLAVIHDSNICRTTGADVQIESLCREDLQNYRLEGTKEHIPLFEEVLALEMPLIVELKVSGGNYKALCEAAWERMKDYPAPWCMESFDPRAVIWLAKNHPEAVRGQLVQNYFRCKELSMGPILRFLLTQMAGNIAAKPDFIACRYADRDISALKRCLRRGIQEVSWTLHSKEELLAAEDSGSIPIFENFNPEADE